jgi:hypothetical protein
MFYPIPPILRLSGENLMNSINAAVRIIKGQNSSQRAVFRVESRRSAGEPPQTGAHPLRAKQFKKLTP